MDSVAIYKQEEIEMKGSLVIISFFIIGIAAGLSGLIPSGLSEGNLTFYALCALLFCVGAGFGYYSLSSIFITEYKGAELGTIALLSNIVREMFTLLLSPLLVKVAGPLAPIAAGGVTSMDTTLPIIMDSSGRQYAVVSLFHGFVLEFSIPFIVTFWCTL